MRPYSYFTPDQYLFEAIWAKTGLADIKPRDPLFESEAYEKGVSLICKPIDASC